MEVALPVVLCLVVIVAGAYLVWMELGRRAREPGPLPPLTEEESSRDVWHNVAAIVICGLSIIGSLVAWRAATTFDEASGLSHQAIDESVRYQGKKALADGKIDFGARLSLLYQEHLRAEATLYKQADAARTSGQTARAKDLEAAARIEGAQARTLAASFLTYVPDTGDDGSVNYDRAAKAELARVDNIDLRTLDPEHVASVQRSATDTRTSAQELVLAGALIIAAMFFFTVADLGARHHRLRFSVPALMASTGGLLVLLIAELG
jgi:hypothetical protein